MAYYSLLVVESQKELNTPAGSLGEALAIFGKELGVKLASSSADGCSAACWLDEWTENPHWVNRNIPIYLVDETKSGNT